MLLASCAPDVWALCPRGSVLLARQPAPVSVQASVGVSAQQKAKASPAVPVPSVLSTSEPMDTRHAPHLRKDAEAQSSALCNPTPAPYKNRSHRRLLCFPHQPPPLLLFLAAAALFLAERPHQSPRQRHLCSALVTTPASAPSRVTRHRPEPSAPQHGHAPSLAPHRVEHPSSNRTTSSSCPPL